MASGSPVPLRARVLALPARHCPGGLCLCRGLCPCPCRGHGHGRGLGRGRSRACPVGCGLCCGCGPVGRAPGPCPCPCRGCGCGFGFGFGCGCGLGCGFGCGSCCCPVGCGRVPLLRSWRHPHRRYRPSHRPCGRAVHGRPWRAHVGHGEISGGAGTATRPHGPCAGKPSSVSGAREAGAGGCILWRPSRTTYRLWLLSALRPVALPAPSFLC